VDECCQRVVVEFALVDVELIAGVVVDDCVGAAGGACA